MASYLSALYRHNAANELVEDATWLYTYDADGNLIERVCKAGATGCTAGERWEYAYNAENRLMGVYQYVGAALVKEVHDAYDALGRRVEKRVVDHGTGTVETTQYVYRDEDVVMAFRVDPGTGQRWVRNVYFHGTLGVDDPVAVYPCDDAACAVIRPLVYAKDHLNSVEALYDVAAQAVVSYGYSTFGVPRRPFVDLQSYTYTSRLFDVDYLYYFRSRQYHSFTGLFLQVDPIKEENDYIYSFQRPTRFYDPLGLQATISIDGSCCRNKRKSILDSSRKACNKTFTLISQGFPIKVLKCIGQKCRDGFKVKCLKKCAEGEIANVPGCNTKLPIWICKVLGQHKIYICPKFFDKSPDIQTCTIFGELQHLCRMPDSPQANKILWLVFPKCKGKVRHGS